MPQSTLTTSSPSSLKNNLQSPYKLLSFFFLLSVQLQSWIWTLYIKTSSQLSLVTQLLQNTSLQMADSLQTQTVYSSSTIEFIYHLLVTSAHVFSSTIMITSLLNILVKTKHWNQSAVDTPGPASMLMYNNSASPVSLVCDPSHNITSPMDPSNNSPPLNNYGIPFLWTSSRNFRHPPGLTLSWSQSTGSPSRRSLFLPMTPSCLFVLHVFSKHGVPSHITSDRGSEFVSNFFRSLGTALNMQLYFTSGYHPEDDGQTECTNQTLKQYLHVYCNYQQDNQSELLPLAEFAYNNAPIATKSVSPFFANKRYHLNITVHLEYDIASSRVLRLRMMDSILFFTFSFYFIFLLVFF